MMHRSANRFDWGHWGGLAAARLAAAAAYGHGDDANWKMGRKGRANALLVCWNSACD